MVLARVFSWLSFFERVFAFPSRARLALVLSALFFVVPMPFCCEISSLFAKMLCPPWAGHWNTENGAGFVCS